MEVCERKWKGMMVMTEVKRRMIEREKELERGDRTKDGISQRESVKREEERGQREESWMVK